MQYPIFRLPNSCGETHRAKHEWTSTNERMLAANKSTEDEEVLAATTTSEPEVIQHIAKSATNTMEND
jgi:hypothetical protein